MLKQGLYSFYQRVERAVQIIPFCLKGQLLVQNCWYILYYSTDTTLFLNNNVIIDFWAKTSLQIQANERQPIREWLFLYGYQVFYKINVQKCCGSKYSLDNTEQKGL